MIGIGVPDTGQFNDVQWVLDHPGGRVALAIALTAAALILALGVLSTWHVTPIWRRIAIVGARIVAITGALVLFLQPVWELRSVVRAPNSVVVLLDDSQSMSLPNRPGGESRLAHMQEVLAASASSLRAWEAQEHKVEVFSFSDQLRRLTDREIASMQGLGPRSLVRVALDAVVEQVGADQIGGIVVLSDGAANGTFGEEDQRRENQVWVQRLEIPIHTVQIGAADLMDIAVRQVFADDFAFVRTVVEVEAVIAGTAIEATTVPVTLLRDGEPLQAKTVTIDQGSPVRVSFQFTPDRVGTFVYEVALPVQEGEVIRENNRQSFPIRVIRDKLRVLHVAGQPSWDARALRGFLKANPNIDLISFFILRTVEDVSNAGPGELSLIQFPTHELFAEELPSFDVVVMQNFNYGPYGIAPYLENIRAFVDGGGGFVMIGGPLSFGAGRYQGTPIAELLPWKLPSGQQTDDKTTFVPMLTNGGGLHPVTRLRFDPSENERLWSSMPPLEGLNLSAGLQKGVWLLGHPDRRDGNGFPLPVLAVREYGKGRVLAVATDSMWFWWFAEPPFPAAYSKFWQNAIRWLTRDPDFSRLELVMDRFRYQVGESVTARVRRLDWLYRPRPGAEVVLEVFAGGDRGQSTQLATEVLKVDGDGRAEYSVGALDSGVYRLRATTEMKGQSMSADEVFVVDKAGDEFVQPNPRPSTLESLAAWSGGRYLGTAASLPADLSFRPARISRVRKHQRLEFIGGGLLFVLILGMLGAEWGLRQQSTNR